MFGFSSCSLDKNTALQFASDRPVREDEVRILYEIYWDFENDHFNMEGVSSFDEKEILISDGAQFKINNIEQELDSLGRQYNLIQMNVLVY